MFSLVLVVTMEITIIGTVCKYLYIGWFKMVVDGCGSYLRKCLWRVDISYACIWFFYTTANWLDICQNYVPVNCKEMSTLSYLQNCHIHFRTWLPCLSRTILNHQLFSVYRNLFKLQKDHNYSWNTENT
jgi:hypothetical protein